MDVVGDCQRQSAEFFAFGSELASMCIILESTINNYHKSTNPMYYISHEAVLHISFAVAFVVLTCLHVLYTVVMREHDGYYSSHPARATSYMIEPEKPAKRYTGTDFKIPSFLVYFSCSV